MKLISPILLVLILAGCKQVTKKPKSIELITDWKKQDTIFLKLLTVTNKKLPETVQNDSLAFLILPVQASCPSCRKKTIDSIIKNSNSLLPNHYIIISANGGRKIINSYFLEEHASIPNMPDQVFIDSINLASNYELYDEKPTMYYTFQRKAYKKVSSIPATVKEDLHEFFSGSNSAE